MKIKPQKDKENENFVEAIDLEAERIADWLGKQDDKMYAMQVFLVSCLMQLDISGYEIIGMLEEAKCDVRSIFLCYEECEGGEDEYESDN